LVEFDFKTTTWSVVETDPAETDGIIDVEEIFETPETPDDAGGVRALAIVQ
jgi:hypothetical protein